MLRYFVSSLFVTSGLTNELFLSPEVKSVEDASIPLIIYGGIGADRNAREIA